MAHNKMCKCNYQYCTYAPWCQRVPERMREFIKQRGFVIIDGIPKMIETNASKIACFEEKKGCILED